MRLTLCDVQAEVVTMRPLGKAGATSWEHTRSSPGGPHSKGRRRPANAQHPAPATWLSRLGDGSCTPPKPSDAAAPTTVLTTILPEVLSHSCPDKPVLNP